MINEIVVRAYAKVNFGLKVFPKNDVMHNLPKYDGYHCIESIFQTIDLYDELSVSWSFDSTRNCKVSCLDMELPEKNTINMAYLAFCQVVKDVEVPSVTVNLKKGIPSGGGLGGGSSDAAALVRVLEKICGVSLSFDQLDLIASKVGSDVFFFMHCDSEGKGSALVSGRGEIIENIKPRSDLFLLVIFPKVSSSTKVAYSLIDKHYEENIEEKLNVVGPEFSDLESIYNRSVQDWTFVNTFTDVISKEYEEIRNCIDCLKKAGCDYADMSGSGSTVFGVFSSMQQASIVKDMLGSKMNCELLRTI